MSLFTELLTVLGEGDEVLANKEVPSGAVVFPESSTVPLG